MSKNRVKTKVRIGKISYMNCLPFFHGLELGNDIEAEYYETYPAKLNFAMRRAQIDLGPVSSLEYLNHSEKYLLLPDIAIGSRDFSGSVILFSKERMEGLDGAEIAISRKSLSSVALLKILLRFKYKFKNRFVLSGATPEEALLKSKAMLVIGDEALFYRSKSFMYKYDLSELWWNWTRKPFCFAVWAVRREYAAEYPEAVASIGCELNANMERNLTDIETLMREATGMTFLDPQFSKVFGYLFNLAYKLDSEMQEGLELFYRLASRLEISPPQKPLEFFGRD